MTIKAFLAKLVDEGATINGDMGNGFILGPWVLSVCEMISRGVVFYTGIDAWSQHDAHIFIFNNALISRVGNKLIFETPTGGTYWITRIEDDILLHDRKNEQMRFELWKNERAKLIENGKSTLSDDLLNEAKWYQKHHPKQNGYKGRLKASIIATESNRS